MTWKPVPKHLKPRVGMRIRFPHESVPLDIIGVSGPGHVQCRWADGLPSAINHWEGILFDAESITTNMLCPKEAL